jgi:uncharacterized protein YktA (UPF0223 family)
MVMVKETLKTMLQAFEQHVDKKSRKERLRAYNTLVDEINEKVGLRALKRIIHEQRRLWKTLWEIRHEGGLEHARARREVELLANIIDNAGLLESVLYTLMVKKAQTEEVMNECVFKLPHTFSYVLMREIEQKRLNIGHEHASHVAQYSFVDNVKAGKLIIKGSYAGKDMRVRGLQADTVIVKGREALNNALFENCIVGNMKIIGENAGQRLTFNNVKINVLTIKGNHTLVEAHFNGCEIREIKAEGSMVLSSSVLNNTRIEELKAMGNFALAYTTMANSTIKKRELSGVRAGKGVVIRQTLTR